MTSDEDESSSTGAVTAEMARVKRKLKATQDELETLKGAKKAKSMYVHYSLLACQCQLVLITLKPARTQR